MSLPDFSLEEKLWNNYNLVAGLDEVGRGSFAGPVVAAAVVFQKGISIPSNVIINDSKKLNPQKRLKARKWIKKNSITYGIGESSVKTINKKGIKKATDVAFKKAVINANAKIDERIQYLLIDAFNIPYFRGYAINSINKDKGHQEAVKAGDSISFSIAAASIIAKVHRDTIMIRYSKQNNFKNYDWLNNKGYATKTHTQAIKNYGTTKLHRKQFVASYLKNNK
jgi:ribonuclease HII